MPIKCTNKNCGHVNADGTSYCVKCGKLIGKKTVVNKSEFDNLNNELQGLKLVKKQLEDRVVTLTTTDKGRIEQLQKKLDNIKKDGSAPSGFRLIKENEYTSLSNNKDELARLKKNGFAPSGYHLEKDKDPIDLFWSDIRSDKITISKSEYESLKSRPNISTSTYNSLKRSANMEWYEKLWDDYSVLLTWAFVILLGLGILYWIFSGEDDEKETLIIEQRDGYWGIAKGSNIILPFEYDSIVRDKYDTIYSRIYKNGMAGLVDNQSGSTIIQCDYKKIGQTTSFTLGGKLIGVQKANGKWCFVNHKGELFGSEYDYARWVNNSDLGEIGIRDSKGIMYYGYADINGSIKIPCRYVLGYPFQDGLAIVKISNYSSLICINIDGQNQFTLRYPTFDGFSESLMAVSNDRQWNNDTRFGYVDRKGNLVIDMFFTPYLSEDGSFYYPRFSNGRAYVRYNGRNGYIDTTGKFTEVK